MCITMAASIMFVILLLDCHSIKMRLFYMRILKKFSYDFKAYFKYYISFGFFLLHSHAPSLALCWLNGSYFKKCVYLYCDGYV